MMSWRWRRKGLLTTTSYQVALMLTRVETPKTYRLMPELVPRPLWGISAYRLLGRGKAWRAIRQATLEAGGQECSICRSTESGLTCHERWSYDDRR